MDHNKQNETGLVQNYFLTPVYRRVPIITTSFGCGYKLDCDGAAFCFQFSTSRWDVLIIGNRRYASAQTVHTARPRQRRTRRRPCWYSRNGLMGNSYGSISRIHTDDNADLSFKRDVLRHVRQIASWQNIHSVFALNDLLNVSSIHIIHTV